MPDLETCAERRQGACKYARWGGGLEAKLLHVLPLELLNLSKRVAAWHPSTDSSVTQYVASYHPTVLYQTDRRLWLAEHSSEVAGNLKPF